MTDVQAYAFGQAESQAPLMLSGLDRLGEKLGRRLRALIEPIAGVRPHVAAHDARALEFGAWAHEVPGSSSIGVYRLSPLKGQVLLRLDAAMISTLVDCFYGGIGNRALPPRGEFTPTEDRLITRISDAFMARLVECWSDMLTIEAGLIVRETGIGFAAAAQPGEQMVLQRFLISVSRDAEWPIQRGAGRDAIVAARADRAGASDRRERAIRIDATNPVIVGVGDVEVALPIECDRLRAG